MTVNASGPMMKRNNISNGLVRLAEIEAAREQLPTIIRRTPIIPFARCASEVGREKLFLKAESLQITGAYKPRAAFTVMNSLNQGERSRGLVLTSSGNFAQAFALAGSLTGTNIVVVMLDYASPYKVNATRKLGAEVFFSGHDRGERHATVRALAEERGMTVIDTWEDPRILAGHGTLALEMIEQFSDVDTILVPVSSGGLAAGVAAAVKESRPGIRVVGVQPERANAAYVSIQKGRPTLIDYWDSAADGLSANRPGELPFRHLQRYLDEIILVSEAEISRAFRTLLFQAKILAEPAGAVAPAAFLSGRIHDGGKTLALVSGGNVTEETVQMMLENSHAQK